MSLPEQAPPWYFQYSPIPIGGGDGRAANRDLVLATVGDVDPATIAEALAGVVRDLAVTPLFSGHPIFWTRVQSTEPLDRALVRSRLDAVGIGVRYLVGSSRGSQRLPPRLDCSMSLPRRPTAWKAREAAAGDDVDSPWRWFLRAEGANVVRDACGTGAGARLAVIDNDGRDIDKVELDAVVLVGVEELPRAAAHAAMLIGWAVGANTGDGSRFRGVAPDASVRLYCIPKAADEIFSLPLAIVRAVDDGADVVVCATYVEGQTSPLLDDALEFARLLGRGRKGTAIVFPAGREMSSSNDSTHSSLSLGLAEPASDPRVFCVGPSARGGGWFLWRDRRGKLRPFANRGPGLRFLAPGDDMAHPFFGDDRPGHAESSGASGIAAGVVALVVSCNPELTLAEIEKVLCDTAVPIQSSLPSDEAELADRHDVLPWGTDADGHNAKHGYGRINASAACLASRDPIAQALVRMGEAPAALSWMGALSGGKPYGDALARWAVLAMLRNHAIAHSCCAVLRACRLQLDVDTREPVGHVLRQVGVVVRLLLGENPPDTLAAELGEIERRIVDADENVAARAEAQILFITRGLHWVEPVRSRSNTRASGTRPALDSRAGADDPRWAPRSSGAGSS